MSSNLPPGVTNSMIEDQVSQNQKAFDLLCDALEVFVDLNCLYSVIEALTQICCRKEDKLREDWVVPDNPLADLWLEASRQLEKLNVQV